MERRKCIKTKMAPVSLGDGWAGSHYMDIQIYFQRVPLLTFTELVNFFYKNTNTAKRLCGLLSVHS